MFGKVKQAIRVGRHVTDLMRLDCVYSCHKEADGTLCYLLYDWDEQGQYDKAHEAVRLMVNRIDMSALEELYKVTKDRRI